MKKRIVHLILLALTAAFFSATADCAELKEVKTNESDGNATVEIVMSGDAQFKQSVSTIPSGVLIEVRGLKVKESSTNVGKDILKYITVTQASVRPVMIGRILIETSDVSSLQINAGKTGNSIIVTITGSGQEVEVQEAVPASTPASVVPPTDETKKKADAEAEAKKAAELKAAQDAAAKLEVEKKAAAEAEAKKKVTADAAVKLEAEKKAAELKAAQETAAKAGAAAEAKKAAELKAAQDAAVEAKKAAELKAAQDAAAKLEAEKKAAAEAEAKKKVTADAAAKLEAEKKTVTTAVVPSSPVPPSAAKSKDQETAILKAKQAEAEKVKLTGEVKKEKEARLKAEALVKELDKRIAQLEAELAKKTTDGEKLRKMQDESEKKRKEAESSAEKEKQARLKAESVIKEMDARIEELVKAKLESARAEKVFVGGETLTRLPIQTGADIFFEFGNADLTPAARRTLDKLAGIIKIFVENKISLEGHSDSTGPSKYNLKLSVKRGESVVKYLVNKGVSKERITVKGCGSKDPIAVNNTKIGRAQNRRVEVIIMDGEE